MSYLKLMDLVANVGGFLSIIMFFFEIFSNLYNGHYMKLTMYDKLFDFSFHSKLKNALSLNNKIETIAIKEEGKNDVSEYSKGNLSNKVMMIKSNSKINNENKINEVQKSEEKLEQFQQNEGQKIEFVNYNPTNPKEENELNMNEMISKKLTKDNIVEFIETKKDNYTSLAELIKDNSTDQEKKQLLDKNLEIAGRFEDKLTDFGCYANLYMEFEYIKHILLNPNQIKALKLVKLSFNNTDKGFMENYLFNHVEDSLDEQTQAEVMNYFITKIDSFKLNNSDRLMLKLLDLEYKDLIYEKISNKQAFRSLLENPYENMN